jgi:RNA-directed DNA polymerase
MLEQLLSRENLLQALKRVETNKGSHGVDGMSVKSLREHIKQNWQTIRQAIEEGIYQPSPVRRVEIPKPNDGTRMLGIPTVTEERKARTYMTEGYRFVVDLDLEKFFDRVHHDRLMMKLATRVKDKKVGGLVKWAAEGTPQGGPLSPLLSNIVLDELDQELEKRGHRFVRYADDCNIYVKTRRAGERVKASVVQGGQEHATLQIHDPAWLFYFMDICSCPLSRTRTYIYCRFRTRTCIHCRIVLM